MEEKKSFQVFVRGAKGSVEDWARMLRAPGSELPNLTEEEKQSAKRLKWDEQDYARNKLLRQLAEHKWTLKGQQLGAKIQEVLKPLESEYRLDSVFAEVPRSRWTVRFTSQKGVCDIHLDDDLVGDVVNFNAIEDLEALRRKILPGLGEEKYLVPHS